MFRKKDKLIKVKGYPPIDPKFLNVKTELPRIKDDKDDIPSIVREKKKFEKLSRWDKRRLRRKPEKSFLIKMLFSNGTSKEFVIATNKETFDYKKRTYYLRYEDSWFNLTQNQYELHFFDDYPVPLDREILKQGDQAYWSVTSDNLKPLIEMQYVKALASAQDLNRFLKMNATLSVFLVFMTLIICFFMFSMNKALTVLAGAG